VKAIEGGVSQSERLRSDCIVTGMRDRNPTASSYVVRFPQGMFVVAILFLGIPMVGFRLALDGRGHWTFWHVAFATVIAMWFLFYVILYRTIFSADAVTQRMFPWFVRRLRYVEIEQVKLRRAGRGVALFLTPVVGKQIRVYGAIDKLIHAQEMLFDKIPQAFENQSGARDATG
jgi:hypothetical protein